MLQTDINNYLDHFNIIYDILIDEESYDELVVGIIGGDQKGDGGGLDWNRFKEKLIADQKPEPGTVFHLLTEMDQKIEESERKIILTKKRYEYQIAPSKLWWPLFIAKKARAIIQQMPSSMLLKVLDEVAEYLMGKLANTYSSNKESPQDFGPKKFRMLYYNEISQCYVGYLSVGYADKALKLYSPGECHYELLGLYNKALGLSHHEDRVSREKSIRYFDQIIITFTSDDANLGYGYPVDVELWRMFVLLPSLLHKAEILIKLQRGYETLKTLDELEKALSEMNKPYECQGLKLDYEYKKRECRLLRAQANLEIGNITQASDFAERCNHDNLHMILTRREEITKIKYRIEAGRDNEYLKGLKGIEAGRDNEYLKGLKGIEAGRDNEYLKGLKGIEAGRDNEYLKNALEDSEKLYQKLQKDIDEQVQVAIYWLEALQLAYDNWQSDQKSERLKRYLPFLTGILQLVNNNLSPEKSRTPEGNNEYWLPMSDKIINALWEVIEKVTEPVQKQLREDGEDKESKNFLDQQKEFCRLQGERYGNKTSSSIRKVKAFRRRCLLGDREVENCYHHLKFPGDEFLKATKDFVDNNLAIDFYTQRLSLNTESFDERLIYHSHWPGFREKIALTVLRKWQSYTPSLGSYSASSRGGGYFLYKVATNGAICDGVVIDPGYDFVENFLEQKFAIFDIEAIVLTHSHIDHTADFRGLVTLFHEMNKRGKKVKKGWRDKKVKIVLTPTCFNHFYSFIEDTWQFIKDVIVVDPDHQGGSCFYELTENFAITAVPAYHKDFEEGNCVGYIFHRRDNKKRLVGFTGDGVWTGQMAEYFKHCPVVCINMGALIDIRKGDSFVTTFNEIDSIKKLVYKENHLYLPGTLSLLEQLCEHGNTKIAVISELGEELKCGLRGQLYSDFNDFIKQRNNCNPDVVVEDIGLTISWEQGAGEPRVRCARCKRPMDFKEIRLKVSEDERKSEQLNYYCPECLEKIEWLEKGDDEKWRRRYWPQPAR